MPQPTPPKGQQPKGAQAQAQDANIEARAAALADDLIAQADAPPGTAQSFPGFEFSDEFKAKAKEFGRDFLIMAFKYALSRFGA